MSNAPVEPAAGAEMLPGEPLGNVRSRARRDLESRDSVGDALISTSARKPEIVVQISIFDFSYHSSHQRNDILGDFCVAVFSYSNSVFTLNLATICFLG